MPIRIAVGGIVHETNTFALAPTGLADFEATRLAIGEELRDLRGTNSVVGGIVEAIEADASLELIPLALATAIPGGTVAREAFERIVGLITDGIAAAGPDAVVLDLHGAMVVDGFPNGDGEVARRVRAIVGPEVPIVAVLDLHGNLDDTLLANTDILLPYHTYPHVDTAERGREAVVLAARMARGEIHPVMRAAKLTISPPGPQQYSEFEPTVSLQRLAREWEAQPGVIDASILFAFPYSDVPHNGMAVVATTEGDPGLADEICASIGEEIIRRHVEFWPNLMPVEEAVHAAMAEPSSPVVLADYGDNPGGGSSCDGTALLWALLDLGAKDAALAHISDPEVVQIAWDAGEGAEIQVDLGGKRDSWHGAPIPVTATVLRLTDGSFVHDGPMNRGVASTLGRTAVLGCRGRYGSVVEVICCERRPQALDTAIFRSQGIEPAERKILVVKSSVHFRGSFGPIASRIIVVDTPGLLQLDVTAFPFRHIRRPLWPHDRDEPRMILMNQSDS
jgi:microcystin degradation protein MlrC